ncbi:hypothetical protein HMSSN139_46740 [Paenibacillus sp. HMSSN-139]|nr:hypothetical protein HMSSN139_46740 [Paenibacillus sp. HMSSN-139]
MPEQAKRIMQIVSRDHLQLTDRRLAVGNPVNVFSVIVLDGDAFSITVDIAT